MGDERFVRLKMNNHTVVQIKSHDAELTLLFLHTGSNGTNCSKQ